MLIFISNFFIPILLVVLFIIGVLIENEEPGKATSIFFIFLAFFGFLHFKELFSFVTTYPKEIMVGFFIYVVIGVVWSLIKWTLFVKEELYRVERYKNKLEKDSYYEGKHDIIFGKVLAHFSIYSANNCSSYEELLDKLTPNPTEKKSIIVSCITYFPISMVATALNNPLRRFFEWVYDNVSGLYERISSNHKKNLLNKLKK